jgi:hypothetical protein
MFYGYGILNNHVPTLRATTMGGGVSIDIDAQAFITAATITNTTQKSAINTLVTDLKTANIWTKMKALYPFVGGTASTHKFNLKDPRDLDAAYRLVFSGGWTHSANGALPNGTTAYADTKLNPFTVFNNTTYNHMSYYSRTATGYNNSEYGMGVVFGVSNFCFVLRRLNNTQAFFSTFLGSIFMAASNSTGSDAAGLLVGIHQSPTEVKLLRRNVLQVRNSGGGTATQPNGNVFIGAVNDSNTTLFGYTNKECAIASLGEALSDTDATNFYNAIQTFQTTLSRQV